MDRANRSREEYGPPPYPVNPQYNGYNSHSGMSHQVGGIFSSASLEEDERDSEREPGFLVLVAITHYLSNHHETSCGSI